ncbi:MAG: NADP-dependent glyceraldehyde-3-phosphate dehydrogenase, partial [Acidilobaceae archaeon]
MSSTRLPLRDNLFKEIYRIEDEVPNFKSYVAGEWIEFPSKITVKSPIDGSIIARVSIPDWEAIDRTLDLVYVKGRWSIRNTPGEKRLKIIDKIADL